VTMKVALIGPDIGIVLGVAEEPEEGLVVRQVAHGGELETGQRDMRPIEIDSNDLAGSGGEIGQDVAAARRDGDQARARRERQRPQVDLRILPDLGVDQTAKSEREDALQNTLTRDGLRPVNCPPQSIGGNGRGRSHGRRSLSNQYPRTTDR